MKRMFLSIALIIAMMIATYYQYQELHFQKFSGKYSIILVFAVILLGIVLEFISRQI